MTWISIGVLWVGYTVLTYGWSQIRGCNAGLFSLIIPGKFTGCNPDRGGGSGGGHNSPTIVGTETAPGSIIGNQFPQFGYSGSYPAASQFSTGVTGSSPVSLGNGRTTPAKGLPGGPGNGVSP